MADLDNDLIMNVKELIMQAKGDGGNEFSEKTENFIRELTSEKHQISEKCPHAARLLQEGKVPLLIVVTQRSLQFLVPSQIVNINDVSGR